ncbi:glycine receptor subunit alpha-2-like [Gigantopelta aegis]|uniref:glycine receptor subunit alpha-2-like n=1 Tax=Gigantopelta aegis TaxID=1735272 RepID=UPI001B887B9D|nr:glycine receptor subunit alpha-2-like [Gigantopelta aegis]
MRLNIHTASGKHHAVINNELTPRKWNTKEAKHYSENINKETVNDINVILNELCEHFSKEKLNGAVERIGTLFVDTAADTFGYTQARVRARHKRENTHDPCEVSVKLFINSFDSVSETQMEFTTNIIIDQRWRDRRLQFLRLIDAQYLELDTKLMDRVWVPDLFIVNEKRSSFHDVTVPNKMMHIYTNGSIVYKVRVSITASCYMDLRKYPMDKQVCSLHIQSFAYTMYNVVFKWGASPVQHNHNNKLPQFELVKIELPECTQISDGNFTCLSVNFVLERSIGFYLLYMYVPSGLIVTISWVSHWLNQDAVPARTSLGILTVLTMTTQSSSTTVSLPKVSYIKAIDVWMATCMTFVVAAFLEYAFVNVILRKEVKKETANKLVAVIRNKRANNYDGFGATCKIVETKCPKCHYKPSSSDYVEDPVGKHRAWYIDKISRIVFPLSFLFFNIIYWLYYCL